MKYVPPSSVWPTTIELTRVLNGTPVRAMDWRNLDVLSSELAAGEKLQMPQCISPLHSANSSTTPFPKSSTSQTILSILIPPYTRWLLACGFAVGGGYLSLYSERETSETWPAKIQITGKYSSSHTFDDARFFAFSTIFEKKKNSDRLLYVQHPTYPRNYTECEIGVQVLDQSEDVKLVIYCLWFLPLPLTNRESENMMEIGGE